MAILRKIRFWHYLGALIIALLAIQNFGEKPSHADEYSTPVETSLPADIQRLNSQELRDLVAPIALYPDALLAQVFPASTHPLDLAEANQFAQATPNAYDPPSSKNWDNSVVALLHYPTVLKKLADDIDWTERLGYAVTYQMQDGANMVQQLRSEAAAVGNLATNDKVQVVTRDNYIEIVPASPEVIYVPTYDPYAVYYRRYDYPLISWGSGFSFGLWLGNSWDWGHHRIYSRSYWDRSYGWRRNYSSSYWSPSYRPLPNWYRRGYSPPVTRYDGSSYGGSRFGRPRYGYSSDLTPRSTTTSPPVTTRSSSTAPATTTTPTPAPRATPTPQTQAQTQRQAELQAQRQAIEQRQTQNQAERQAQTQAQRQAIEQRQVQNQAEREAQIQARTQAREQRQTELQAQQQARAQERAQEQAQRQAIINSRTIDHSEGLGSSRFDISRESSRGSSSRVIPRAESTPIQRVTPAPVERSVPQRSYSSGLRPSEGSSVQRESSRGSFSRGRDDGDRGRGR